MGNSIEFKHNTYTVVCRFIITLADLTWECVESGLIILYKMMAKSLIHVDYYALSIYTWNVYEYYRFGIWHLTQRNTHDG